MAAFSSVVNVFMNLHSFYLDSWQLFIFLGWERRALLLGIPGIHGKTKKFEISSDLIDTQKCFR